MCLHLSWDCRCSWALLMGVAHASGWHHVLQPLGEREREWERNEGRGVGRRKNTRGQKSDGQMDRKTLKKWRMNMVRHTHRVMAVHSCHGSFLPTWTIVTLCAGELYIRCIPDSQPMKSQQDEGHSGGSWRMSVPLILFQDDLWRSAFFLFLLPSLFLSLSTAGNA